MRIIYFLLALVVAKDKNIDRRTILLSDVTLELVNMKKNTSRFIISKKSKTKGKLFINLEKRRWDFRL